MASKAEQERLPPGLRSDLVNAIHADDPKAVAKNLEACNRVRFHSLRSPHPPSSSDSQDQPLSALRSMDNALYELITLATDPELRSFMPTYMVPYKAANIYTLAFVIAARRNCTGELPKMRVVELLTSDMYRMKVDVGYGKDEVLCAAVRSGNTEFVKL